MKKINKNKIKIKQLQPLQIALQNYFPYLAVVLDPFLQIHPVWQGAFFSAIGLFGVYMAYNQEEVNEITQLISEHPKEFRSEIVKSNEFQKGFLIYLENYFKQRIKRKKEIHNKIFLDYAKDKEKEKFELERLNDAAYKVSLEALNCLDFLETEIIPIYAAERKNMRIFGFGQTLEKWLYDKFRVDSEVFKKSHPEINQITDEQREYYANLENTERKKIMNPFSELVSLDILQMLVVGGATFGGGAGADYMFTDFGIKFMEYIK